MYNKDSRVADIALSHPLILPLLNRFLLHPGFGDETVAQACWRVETSADFFLAVVNTYVDDGYFPEDTLRSAGRESLKLYLLRTDDYYTTVQIPNIERHFFSLLKRSEGMDNNLDMILRFFNELHAGVDQRSAFDHEAVCSALEDNGTPLTPEQLQRLREIDESVEDKVADLVSFFVIHLRGDYDRNLCTGVIVAASQLATDIRKTNRIRRRILYPQLEASQR